LTNYEELILKKWIMLWLKIYQKKKNQEKD
jgi:hypothetical protein